MSYDEDWYEGEDDQALTASELAQLLTPFHAAVETAPGPNGAVGDVDEQRLERALSDLDDDVYRTGGKVTRVDLQRTASRHKLSVVEAALLEMRAEAADLVTSDGDAEDTDVDGLPVPRSAESVSSVDSLEAWFAEAGRFRLLTGAEEVALARAIEAGKEAEAALERTTDASYRAKLEEIAARGVRARVLFVSSNLRLVANIAKRYRGQGVDFLDLMQDGVMGLLRAVAKFDWTLGYKFSTYATWWIRQSVQRSVDNNGRVVRIPVHILERIRKLRRQTRQLEIRLQREPTLGELAESLGLDPAEVAFLLDLEVDIVSLDRPVRDDGEAATLGELLPAPGPSVEDQVAESYRAELARRALTRLDSRERHILERRFGLDDDSPDTLEEIGRDMNVTRERVRQLQDQALKKLRGLAEVRQLFEGEAF